MDPTAKHLTTCIRVLASHDVLSRQLRRPEVDPCLGGQAQDHKMRRKHRVPTEWVETSEELLSHNKMAGVGGWGIVGSLDVLLMTGNIRHDVCGVVEDAASQKNVVKCNMLVSLRDAHSALPCILIEHLVGKQ